jgi:hypothetical protein
VLEIVSTLSLRLEHFDLPRLAHPRSSDRSENAIAFHMPSDAGLQVGDQKQTQVQGIPARLIEQDVLTSRLTAAHF